MTTYQLAQDNNGHWYVIPTDKAEEFDQWIYSENDEIPNYVRKVNGSYSQVTFTGWKIN